MNLAAANATAAVILTWTNSDAVGVEWTIERATSDDFSGQVFDIDDLYAGSESYTDSTVATDTTYYYRVAEIDAQSDQSAWSNTVSITTVPAPSDPLAAVVGPGTGPPAGVKLTWQNNANPAVAQVDIRRATDDKFTQDVTDFTGVDAGDGLYTDNAVKESTTYYYEVRTDDGNGGYSAWSDSASVLFATVPDKPTGLKARVVGPVSGPPAGVSLTWSNPSLKSSPPVSDVVVKRLTVGNKELTPGNQVIYFLANRDNKSYTDTSVVEGTPYVYRVRADNQVSNSSWSRATKILFTTQPAVPAGLAATLTGSSVSLNWTETPNDAPAADLVVERANDSGFTSGVTDVDIDPAALTYLDNNVSQGTTYYYRVKAHGLISDSAWSNVAPILVPATTPSAPANLDVHAFAPGTGPGRVDLTWTEDNGASPVTGFIIQRATDASFTTGFASFTAGPTASAYTLAGLLRGHTYYIRIEALNETESSGWTTTGAGTPR
jgi:fibronectin type 3 domain-containing protein